MSDIRDFRKIADEEMCDINVTEEMKNAVIDRCIKRWYTRMPVLRLAAVAACGVFIFSVLHFTGVLKPNLPDLPDYQVKSHENQQPGIFAVPDGEESLPGDSGISIMNEPFAEWQPDSLEEAGRSFGEGFLAPTHIPEGYKLIGIYASGTEQGRADNIVINYNAGELTFVIIEQKTEEAGEYAGFETVDINGNSGYIISNNAGTVAFTQLYWADDGVMYTISGAMTKEDALETARSMKPAVQE